MKDLNSNRKIFIIAGVVTLLIIVLIIAQIIHNKNTNPTIQAKDYTGNQGVNEDSLPQTWPAFSNLNSLLDHGLTLDQISGVSTAMKAYQPFTTKGTLIDFANSNLQLNYPDPGDPLYRPFLTTNIIVNQKINYRVKLYYWDTSSIQLYLYDQTGKTQIYNSGVIKGIS